MQKGHMEYEIIASGSSGNCVVIGNIMVDCGVSYNRLKERLFDVDYLIITHIHTDHLKETTYERIRKQFPNIVVITNWQVSEKLNGDVDVVVDIGEITEVGEYSFETFEAIHDVVNCGYCWSVEENGETIDIIYVTDTEDLAHAPDREFDYLFLESNHDENILNAIKKNARKKYGYDAYGHGLRHCSTQKCKAYYYKHRKSENSELIELHKSSRFYRWGDDE